MKSSDLDRLMSFKTTVEPSDNLALKMIPLAPFFGESRRLIMWQTEAILVKVIPSGGQGSRIPLFQAIFRLQ
jgi:hypothetical protein